MTPDLYQQISVTFLRLCELSAEEQRVALQVLSSTEPDVHKAVEAMLRTDGSDNFLGSGLEERLPPLPTVRDSPESGLQETGSAWQEDEVLMGGRYQLCRLHASGGMGRIWLARDTAIDRDVAIKELRPEDVSTPSTANRFLNEAKVTGQLEHPGIVPVYEVQAGENSHPFYTMRFVKGRTLHEAIVRFTERRREKGFSLMELRELITALVGVANTIGYAHSRSVLHRDLKGQNVVLGDFGEVIVLDWGLACVMGNEEFDNEEIPASGSGISDLTNAGQAIGTPSRMSPEQASGQRSSMDRRTDVFGLGAILYEILTGQVPYRGTNVVDTLKQAQDCDPPLPRTLWNKVPRPLEAICLKAMSKSPVDRYESASAFAEDLLCWQADEPVQAFRDPISVRISRWSRQHKTVATTAVALTVAVLVFLSISRSLISLEQQRTADAHSRAEANLAKAREAVQGMLTEVGSDQLNNVPLMEKLRENLLRKALVFNESFLLESEEPEVLLDAGRAYGNMASIFSMLGNSEESIESWRKGNQVLEKLHTAHPRNEEYRDSRVASLLNTGRAMHRLGAYSSAEKLCREAIKLLEEADNQKLSDDGVMLLAGCLEVIGQTQDGIGDETSAEASYLKAINKYSEIAGYVGRDPERQLERARALQLLGEFYSRKKDTEKAKTLLTETLNLCKEVVSQDSEKREYREALAAVHAALCNLHRKSGNRLESRQHAMDACHIQETLAEDFPYNLDYQNGVSVGRGLIGICHAEAGEYAEAERFFVQSAGEARELAERFPAMPSCRYQAAISIRVLATLLFNTRRIEQAQTMYLDVVQRFESLIADFPDDPTYRIDLAITLNPLARSYRLSGEIDEASKLVERAIALNEALLAEKNATTILHKLAQDYRLMGELLAEAGETDGAEEYLRKAIAAHRETVAVAPEIGEHRRWVAIGLEKLAYFIFVNKEKDVAEALVGIEEAIAIRQQLMLEQPTWFQIRAELPSALLQKGRIQKSLGHTESAVEIFELAIRYCADLVSEYANNSNLREDFATSYEELARVHRSSGLLQQAIEAFALATAVRRKSVQLFPEEERATSQLRTNLNEAAEQLLEANENEGAVACLLDAVLLPAASWKDNLQTARLLTKSCQIGVQAKIAETARLAAVQQLLDSIAAGLPNALQEIGSADFTALQGHESWKAVVDEATAREQR